MENNLVNLANNSINKSRIRQIVSSEISESNNDIAIIGMAGKIGDSENLDDFFKKIVQSYDFIRDFPEDRKKDADAMYKELYPEIDLSKVRYVKGGYMTSIDSIDYEFFGIPYIEIETMEPVQRAIFETTMQALWDAGYTEEKLYNTKTGVFVGNSNTAIESYKQYLIKCDQSLKDIALAGNLNSILSSRISYYLNLKGNSMVIDTACSSGLVALNAACEELKRGECNMAIVAGAKIHLLPPIVQDRNIEICSDDGYTRTFDYDSNGTGIGEGVISLILKPLKAAKMDRDNIYAVIKGSVVNQDGKSVGITAPNAESQMNLLLDAWDISNVNPCDIQYIEAHGTATKLGDVIEIEAITKAFNYHTNAKQICAIGSVKSNVGHTDSISGLVGLVKCIYSLNQKKIPATMHFEKPNSEINFIKSPVYVNSRCKEWELDNAKKRTCCVSSFGLSGTNACVVLEEYEKKENIIEDVGTQTLWISAKNKKMLGKLVRSYYDFVKLNPTVNLINLCYTANKRRELYKYKVKIEFDNYDELLLELVNIYSNLDNDCELVMEQKELEQLPLYHNAHCIRIPTHPLDKKRCWIMKKQYEQINTNKGNDLMADLLVSMIKENIYEIDMSINRQWELGEHKVNDKYLLVGTAYMEIVAQIAQNYYGINSPNIYDFTLINGLYTEKENDFKFQIYIQPDGERFKFEMYSRQNRINTIHCKGYFDQVSEKKTENIDITSILSKVEKTNKISPDIYLYGLVEISSRWHVTKNIYIGNDYYIAEIEIPESYKLEAENYCLYPTVLDAALNFSNTLQGIGTYLPWQYGSIEVFKKVPNKVYSLIKVNENERSKEVLKFDVTLIDTNGNVVLKIKDYVVKRVKFGEENIQNNLCFSQRRWIKMDKREIEYKHYTNTLVVCSDNFEVLDDLDGVERIIYDCTLNHYSDYDSLEIMYERSYMSFISLIKNILRVRPKKLKEIMIISNNGYKILDEQVKNPFGASLAAGLKSLKFEYPNYTFRYVDYDENERQELFEKINIAVNSTSVAIRNGEYYREEVVEVNKSEVDNIGIRKGGTYIITGGLGGVGLTIADELSVLGAGRVILLGRSNYQDLKDLDVKKYTNYTTIGTVLGEIKNRGTKVEYYTIDISNYEAFSNIMETVLEKYGVVNGVIHAAGLPGSGLFYTKEIEELKNVLDVKIKGITNLSKSFEQSNCKVDFIIACSSFTALAGSIGQWDYAVGNEFMNAYCTMMNEKSNIKYLSVMWPTWEESGMAHQHGFKKEECILWPISNKEGKEYIKKVLSMKENEVIIGKWNNQIIKNKDVKLNIKFYDDLIWDDIKEKEIELNTKAKPKEFQNSLQSIKEQLAKLWTRVLGREDIDDDDKFFEMEGNSILATYLLNEINEVYNNIFDITDIFTYSSIRSMSDAIYKKIQTPNKVNNNIEDELDELLQGLVNGSVTVDYIKTKI